MSKLFLSLKALTYNVRGNVVFFFLSMGLVHENDALYLKSLDGSVSFKTKKKTQEQKCEE